MFVSNIVLDDNHRTAAALDGAGGFAEVSEAVRTVRSCRPLTGDWKRNIEADYKARK